ncbi:MAG TPA: peptide chain release factor N(5)-glutamine methyltransferase [Deltaproteobacteria bacterium]|nr:peptide chain release factor N(5)-glutamine methyltransferase [Deltaproteobacteria bacterium]
MGWTIRSILSWSRQYLQDKGIDSPRLDAELLLAYSLGIKRIDLYLDMDRPLAPDELGAYRQFLKRRSYREPVAYILGEKEFYSRTFQVNSHVLIPRPESELLVEQAAALAPAQGRILEIGVGSGAVIISVLAERQDLTGFGCDVNPRTMAVAKSNASRHGVSKRVRFFIGDGLSALRERFDCILMNPPYIALSQADQLSADVLHYEPHDALFGGNDGLDIIKEILKGVGKHLSEKGRFIMETGYGQKEAVDDLIGSMKDIRTHAWIKDLSGIDRVVVVERCDG